jgi:hypothetical protein
VHQLRHNVWSAAEALGYDKAEITELLGHSRQSITDQYIDDRVARYRKMLIAVDAAIQELIRGKSVQQSERSTSRPGQVHSRPRSDSFISVGKAN